MTTPDPISEIRGWHTLASDLNNCTCGARIGRCDAIRACEIAEERGEREADWHKVADRRSGALVAAEAALAALAADNERLREALKTYHQAGAWHSSVDEETGKSIDMLECWHCGSEWPDDGTVPDHSATSTCVWARTRALLDATPSSGREDFRGKQIDMVLDALSDAQSHICR